MHTLKKLGYYAFFGIAVIFFIFTVIAALNGNEKAGDRLGRALGSTIVLGLIGGVTLLWEHVTKKSDHSATSDESLPDESNESSDTHRD